MIKRTTQLFNWLWSNVAKQVARLCCPFYRSLRKNDNVAARSALDEARNLGTRFLSCGSKHSNRTNRNWQFHSTSTTLLTKSLLKSSDCLTHSRYTLPFVSSPVRWRKTGDTDFMLEPYSCLTWAASLVTSCKQYHRVIYQIYQAWWCQLQFHFYEKDVI